MRCKDASIATSSIAKEGLDAQTFTPATPERHGEGNPIEQKVQTAKLKAYATSLSD